MFAGCNAIILFPRLRGNLIFELYIVTIQPIRGEIMRKRSQLLSATLTTFLILVVALPSFAYEALNGPTGVLLYDQDKTCDGYTLFAATYSKKTYLMDNTGQIIHTWKSKYNAGLHAVLLDNGNLLRAGSVPPFPLVTGGMGGIVEEIDWDGNVVWQYKLANKNEFSHHTFYRMPNGNTLLIAFERVSQKKAAKLGRKELFDKVVVGKKEHKDFWIDFIREVNPKGKTVWEWHMTDHMGQGPDKLNINYALPKGAGLKNNTYDWSHLNTVFYLPKTDQILINSRSMSEFYLINHKTGKIEYRWGNDTAWDPKAKKPGFSSDGDQKVFGSHCVTPMKNGHFLIFDNGTERPTRQNSRVIEFDPKTNTIVWEYKSISPNSFMSNYQGSVQRLPNGNTLITSSNNGHIFEVTKDKKVVWEFVNPIFMGKAKIEMKDDQDVVPPARGLALNAVHRAYKYPEDHPAFAGKDMSPKGYIAGDDAPVFYKAWKRGSMLDATDNFDNEEDEDEEEGTTMNAY